MDVKILRTIKDKDILPFALIHSAIIHLRHVPSFINRHVFVYLTISCRLAPMSISRHQLSSSNFLNLVPDLPTEASPILRTLSIFFYRRNLIAII